MVLTCSLSLLLLPDALSNEGDDHQDEHNPDDGVPESIKRYIAAVEIVVRVAVVLAPSGVVVVATHRGYVI